MREPTFDEFVSSRIAGYQVFPRNAYVRHPGWKSLYVRVTKRYLDKTTQVAVIDLANIEAAEPGKGTFRKLVAHIQETYPTMTIFVESVLEPNFGYALWRMGFEKVDSHNSFYLKPKEASE